ncbi:hypothetical protein HDU80_011052 [Chytriomyces hyalinus]|nr:hypothetical protein HDU80_011052 [Chytriomyces hyalinus]
MLAVALLQTFPDNPAKNPLIGSWSGDPIGLIGDECDEIAPFVTEQELAEMEQCKVGIKFSKYAWENVQLFDHIDELTSLFSRGKETKHVIANLDTYESESGGVMKALHSCLFYSDEVFGGGDLECYKKGGGQDAILPFLKRQGFLRIRSRRPTLETKFSQRSSQMILILIEAGLLGVTFLPYY